MTNEKYNGWANYATWRVNLEMLDGYETTADADPYDLSLELKDFVIEILEQDTENNLTLSYAMAFIADVNFYEIAAHLIDSHKGD